MAAALLVLWRQQRHRQVRRSVCVRLPAKPINSVFVRKPPGREKRERRPGLWQLPNTPGLLDERQAGAFASGQGLGDVRLRSARDGRHIFTHIVWTMRCYTLECSAMPPQYRWAAPDELRTEISLPTAFRQFLEDTY